MPKQDKAEPASLATAVPPGKAEAQLPLEHPEPQQDQSLSNTELDKVSGGVWRFGRWYPY